MGWEMPLKMDLMKEYADLLRQRLAAKGYAPPTAETDEETFTRYLNMLNRSIEPRPRVTKKAAGFTCPPEHRAGFDALVKVSETGGNLRPYQSTGMENDKYDDGMLNEWGLHHFHLGTGPHPTIPGYVSRTPPLLYAVVTPDNLYCIAILAHQQWSNQLLLDIMHQNFPELTNSATFKSSTLKPQGLAVRYSDSDVQKLRNAGINTITKRPDGTIMMGPGGGVNLKKKKGEKSSKVAIANIEIRKTLQEMEVVLNEQALKIGVPNGHEVHLVEENGQLIVRDAAGTLRAPLPELVKPLW